MLRKLCWMILLSVLIPTLSLATPRLIATSTVTLSRPHDVALSPDGKRLFVADLGNNEVRVLQADTLKSLGGIGGKILNSPHDVAFDATGRLLVADTGHGRVVIFQMDGTKARMVGELKGMIAPEGVSPGPDGSVFVGDTGANAIVKFDKNGRSRSVGRGGKGQLEFARPHDVELDPRGRLFIADPGNDRVVILNADLQLMLVLGGPGFGFNEPKYLNVDDQSRLWVADQHNNRIVMLDISHRVGLILPTEDMAAEGLRLNLPEGIVVRGTRVWVADTYNHRVLLFTLE